MSASGPILELQAYINERWAIAQPKFYPEVAEAPCVDAAVTAREARCFLAAVPTDGSEPPLFEVDDERRLRSDRLRPRQDGKTLSFHFFEAPGRLQTRNDRHIAAMARLREEFG